MFATLVVFAVACGPSQQPLDPTEASSPCHQPMSDGSSTFVSITDSSPGPEAIARSRDRLFALGQDELVELEPPIDWNQDPFNDRSWRYRLHALVPLGPVLVDYQQSQRSESLDYAVELALDWIAANPLNGNGLSEFTWYDTAVGIRVSFLSYIIAELEKSPGSADPDTLAVLRCGAVDHAEWLFDDANYKPRHNHGLLEDAGLFVAALNLSEHPRADAWRLKAETRFVDNVTSTFDPVSGLHLEHSPTYHETITETVANLSDEVGLARDELAPLVSRMYDAGGWYVMPDGHLPQFGDTDRRVADEWMVERSDAAVGLGWFPEAGLGVYRESDAYLAFASWHHSTTHKHSDELTFVWAEAGHRIVIDSGRYGYYYNDPERVYAESSPAHNTAYFGDDPFEWRDVKPYGSGMLDHAEADGWVAMLAENRNTKTSDFVHRRALAYKPGVALIIVDVVDGSRCRDAVGHLHFAPGWTADAGGGGGAGSLASATGDASLSIASNWNDLTFAAGQDDPIKGFTFPANREAIPIVTATLEGDDACDEPLVTVLTLGDSDTVVIKSAARDQATIQVAGETVTVTIDDDRVTLGS